MFKKLSAALVAASLVAFAQPALAQPISPIPIEKLPVFVGIPDYRIGPTKFVRQINLKYDQYDRNSQVNTAALRSQFGLTGWVINSAFTASTFDGVPTEPRYNPILLARSSDSPQFYCVMSGYLYGLVGIITQLDCSSDKSLINKASKWTGG